VVLVFQKKVTDSHILIMVIWNTLMILVMCLWDNLQLFCLLLVAFFVEGDHVSRTIGTFMIICTCVYVDRQVFGSRE